MSSVPLINPTPENYSTFSSQTTKNPVAARTARLAAAQLARRKELCCKWTGRVLCCPVVMASLPVHCFFGESNLKTICCVYSMAVATNDVGEAIRREDRHCADAICNLPAESNENDEICPPCCFSKDIGVGFESMQGPPRQIMN